METVFWDVDTQRDFIDQDGKLAVEGAGEIRENLERLTRFARDHGRRILGSVDWHRPGDKELSEQPDFEQTFPPHCLEGTEGQEKIPETTPRSPLWIDPEPMDADQLEAVPGDHEGELFFRKRRFDVFSNPNLPPILETIDPFQIVVYGVTLDVCVHHAIRGFLDRRYQVTLIEDATRALQRNREDELIMDWRNQGVQIISTEEALSGYIV